MSDIDPASEHDPTETSSALGDATLGDVQYLDTNADSYVDTIAVANADGTTDVFADADQNGVSETAIRYRADGSVGAAFGDTDQNGYYDVALVDQTGNGVLDTTVADTDGNGQFDTTVTDLNENGVLDTQEGPYGGGGGIYTGEVGGTPGYAGNPRPAAPGETGPGIIGPATNPDPLVTLIMNIAGETGQVVYPPSDRDGDMYSDNEDRYPGDPYRH